MFLFQDGVDYMIEETCIHLNRARLLIEEQLLLIVIVVHYSLSRINGEHVVVHVLFILKGRDQHYDIQYY
jgi:hypothetical protein